MSKCHEGLYEVRVPRYKGRPTIRIGGEVKTDMDRNSDTMRSLGEALIDAADFLDDKDVGFRSFK